MNAFSSLLIGQVTANAGYEARNFNTSVTLTSLIDTEEFGFLDEDYLNTGLSSNLQDFVADVNAPETLGITYPNETGVSANQRHYPPLPQTLEELFQNVTISLMSFPDLWANKTSMTAPPPVMVTFPSSVPTYAYAREKLWLTYGIAIALSFASTAFYTVVMVVRGCSYDCNFSTILRTTRHAELDAEIAASDTAGTAPLPKYLADTRIRFVRSGHFNGGAEGGEVEMADLPTQEPLLPLPVPTQMTEDGSVSSSHGNEGSSSSGVSTVKIENHHDLPEDAATEYRAEGYHESEAETGSSG